MLQEFLFPNVLLFDESESGTAPTSPPFSYLRKVGEAGEEVVTLTGFEPVLLP